MRQRTCAAPNCDNPVPPSAHGWNKKYCTEACRKRASKRKRFYYELLRPLIHERDGRQCVLCQAADLKLEVHHIDDISTNHDPHNLISVCHDCHQKCHGYWMPQHRLTALAKAATAAASPAWHQAMANCIAFLIKKGHITPDQSPMEPTILHDAPPEAHDG